MYFVNILRFYNIFGQHLAAEEQKELKHFNCIFSLHVAVEKQNELEEFITIFLASICL